MFWTPLVRYFRRRAQRAQLGRWQIERERLLARLVNEVLSPATPYLLDAAPSFLQRGAYGAFPKVTIDLFLHAAPLAVLLLSPAERPRYLEARAFVDEPAWRARQEALTRIRRALLAQGCPLLEVADDDPHDPASLKERLRLLTGSL